MTKLELTISASSLECVTCDDQTAQVLGLPSLPTNPLSPSSNDNPDQSASADARIKLENLLADEREVRRFKDAVHQLQRQPPRSFQTLNLVFRAPNAEEAALPSDRSPLQDVFASPIRAIHTSGPLHLSCFTHLQIDNDDSNNDTIVRISALEYSREHRSRLLRQEFASWLVEDHIEKSVIATTDTGTVVFWNRFATSLYQYAPEEALGKDIRDLISSKLSLEQGNEMMQRLAMGEHFSSMHLCSRKDRTDFMAHVTTTPILNQEDKVQFIVGVSADYSQLHNVVTELEELNANLEKEVVARTEQLLAREKHLRMIGAAMKESDTGVLITNQNYKITWCNDAVSRMLGLKQDVILGMFPWDLPLQQEQKHDNTIGHSDSSGGSHNNNNAGRPMHDASFSSLGEGAEDDKASSLESYFLREKEINEESMQFQSPPSPVADSGMINNGNKDSATTTITAVSSSSNSMSLGASTSTLEASASALPYHKPPKRPPMAAICYRIDRPTRPLHVMVSVEVMPPEAPISVKRSVSKSARRHYQMGSESASSLAFEPTPDQLLNKSSDHFRRSQSLDETKASGSVSNIRNSRATQPSNGPQFMITLRDITAERKAEEAQLIAERASAANEAKTQMMQMLSHELRTPLQGIMGVASTSMMDIEDNDKPPSSNTSSAASSSSSSSTGGGVKGAMYDSLSTILASSRLLLTLINNTLDTRKINADMMQKIELSSVSMMHCIRDSFQYCGPFAAINEAVLELADPGGANVKLPQILSTSTSKSNLATDVLKKRFNVLGNRLRLEQVIVNLLSNGIKYTTPGTAVVASVRNSSLASVLEEIKASPSSSLKFLSEEELKELDEKAASDDGEVAVFSVRDHGNGIPPEETGKVFGEFQQLEVSTEKDNKYEGGGSGQSSGSGLGLNLSMKFVTLMHGHIWFQNCTDGHGGVTFSFYLNASRTQRDSILTAAGGPDEGGSSRASKRGSVMNESSRSDGFQELELQQEKMSRIRVLVIDDSMINLKVLARMMTKLKVQHCKTALSGAAALEYLEPIRNDPSLVPNLILCDLQMPGMDGYELMTHLREMDICSSPIIMACSADWGSETEGKCHDVGFDGLLRKPITVTYLQEFLTNTKLN